MTSHNISPPMAKSDSSSFIGHVGTWLMILSTLAFGLVIAVEVINIVAFEAYSEDYFLEYHYITPIHCVQSSHGSSLQSTRFTRAQLIAHSTSHCAIVVNPFQNTLQAPPTPRQTRMYPTPSHSQGWVTTTKRHRIHNYA